MDSLKGLLRPVSSRRTTYSVHYSANIHMDSTNNQPAATIPRVGVACDSWISNKRAR